MELSSLPSPPPRSLSYGISVAAAAIIIPSLLLIADTAGSQQDLLTHSVSLKHSHKHTLFHLVCRVEAQTFTPNDHLIMKKRKNMKSLSNQHQKAEENILLKCIWRFVYDLSIFFTICPPMLSSCFTPIRARSCSGFLPLLSL